MSIIKKLCRAATLTFVALTTGCVEYEIRTTVVEDGGGVRSERIVVDQSGDTTISLKPEAFLALMNLGEDRGWSRSSELRDGDTVQVFERETRVRNAADWSRLSGAVRIDGALPGADTRIGPNGAVRATDVRFRNAVDVTTRQGEDGRIFVYRETFTFDNVIDAIVENRLTRFRRGLEEHYGDLDPALRGELLGLARAGLRTAVDLGVLDTDRPERDDERIAATVQRTTDQAEKLLVRHRPDADPAPLVSEIGALLDEGGEQDEEFISEHLPGAELAGNTAIRLQLEMPGDVVSSNAHERDGSTLVWEFGPWDAAVIPVEIYAESALR